MRKRFCDKGRQRHRGSDINRKLHIKIILGDIS